MRTPAQNNRWQGKAATDRAKQNQLAAYYRMFPNKRPAKTEAHAPNTGIHRSLERLFGR